MARQAKQAFTSTRSARFAESRERSAAQKAAEVEAGTRRTMVIVDVADVRDDDMVATEFDGFVRADQGGRENMATANGQTAAMRFQPSDN